MEADKALQTSLPRSEFTLAQPISRDAILPLGQQRMSARAMRAAANRAIIAMRCFMLLVAPRCGENAALGSNRKSPVETCSSARPKR